MAVALKKKPEPDTATLLSQARAGLAAIEAKRAELDARRLETDPDIAVKAEIELAAARKDAERRIALLEERAAQELKQRQAKAQADLIKRVRRNLLSATLPAPKSPSTWPRRLRHSERRRRQTARLRPGGLGLRLMHRLVCLGARSSRTLPSSSIG